MKFLILLLLCVTGRVLFGQAGAGTITGTVTDPTGAVVANASVEAKNTATGVVYPTQTTATGNYTLAQLPPGTYTLTVTLMGFKTYVHSNLQVPAATTVRQDATLEVGAAGESVTVTAEASLLKTESGELSHNVTLQQLDELPILGIGGINSGSQGVRNPYNSLQMLPGVFYAPNTSIVINGAPANTEGMRIEGTTMTNHFVSFAPQEMQPSPDAVQEVAIQTSNYAPEFGNAGGGLLNMTVKSGTNQYHGSAYDYFVNEDLNAAYPFTHNAAGHKIRPTNRQNDYGGTLGGPVVIPKLYDGHNKTFFFFNWEEFLNSSTIGFPLTLPNAAYRAGDFSAISANGSCSLCSQLGIPKTVLTTTPAGIPVYANEIFDPLTRNVAAGTATPFLNNVIPASRLDPVSLRIQNLFPNPTGSGLVSNGAGSNLSQRTTILPALKVDQAIGSKSKLAFYWAKNFTDSQYSTPNGNADGLPAEITNARGTFFHYWISTLNFDYTITPTLLLHLGAGYNQIAGFDDAPYLTFNAQQQLGLSGFELNRNFPYISGMAAAAGAQAALGGMQPVGTAAGIQGHPYPQEMPNFNANATWVKGSHTFKLGSEVYFQGSVQAPFSTVLLPTGPAATALPYTPANFLPQGQTNGFGYASFLLGDYNQIQQGASADYHLGKQQWGLFLQDSWKATRRLTLDYGLRWDYGTTQVEQYGRTGVLGNIPNPGAGGRIGGTIYGATCHCSFANNYPYAVAPRLGVAYQITPKTVLRGGWGFAYSYVPDLITSPPLAGYNIPAGPNAYVALGTGGPSVIPQPVFPNFNPAAYPTVPGVPGSGPTAVDPNAGRPPRQMQYSIGIQREITPNLVLEASYVGNRGVWWTQAGTANLSFLEQVSPAVFAAYGLNPYTNYQDNLLLSQPVSSPGAIQRFGHQLSPYAGFPATSSVLQALEPYPQFTGNIFGPYSYTNAPTGKTWYDSLQVKGTKRLSHGLLVNGTFTWSKALANTREDFWNPASSSKTYQSTDQPFLFNANILYTIPNLLENHNKLLQYAVRDWQFGAFLQYGSGFLLTPPAVTGITNNLTSQNGTISRMLRVPGQPLYLKDLNCHCINPYSDQVLNPAAWVNPGPGQWGENAMYGDFRGQRIPMENFNIGRNFRVNERVNLQIRAEFVNIFNRTYLGYPNTSFAPVSRNQAGQITGGFGTINDVLAVDALPRYPSVSNNITSTISGCLGAGICGQPRTGTLIARFTF